jgi:hypothetical protein
MPPPRTQAPLKFIREAQKHDDDPTWVIFCIDDPSEPVPVDAEYVEANPGKYELRHNDTIYFETVVGKRSANRDDDMFLIQARASKQATTGALDSLLSQNDRLQTELAREREVKCEREKDYDRIRDENHRLKDEMRNMTIAHLDSEREDKWIEEGIKLGREAMYAWQAKDFMDQLQARVNRAFPKLNEEDRKMANHLFEKLTQMDEFRLPELPAETEIVPAPH